MTDKKTIPAPATKSGADADKTSTNKPATRDRTMSKEELDKVSGGINPQPLPPRADPHD